MVTERGPRAVSGTLFQDAEPRLVTIRDIPVEARLGPHMLYVRNQDRPGLIGALGKILGDAEINIATFHLGRDKPGGDAIALVEVDGPIPETDPGRCLRAAAGTARQAAELLTRWPAAAAAGSPAARC